MRKLTLLVYLLLPLSLIGQGQFLPLEYEIPNFFKAGDLVGVESLTVRGTWLRRGKVEDRVFLSEYQLDSLGRTVSQTFTITYERGEPEINQVIWDYDVEGYLWTANLNGTADAITAKRTVGNGYHEDTLFHKNGMGSLFRFYEDRKKTEFRYAMRVDMLDQPIRKGAIEYDEQGTLMRITQDGKPLRARKENGKLIMPKAPWATNKPTCKSPLKGFHSSRMTLSFKPKLDDNNSSTKVKLMPIY